MAADQSLRRLQHISSSVVRMFSILSLPTPIRHGRLELTKFRNPKLVEIEPATAPPNTLALRSVMFTVESIDDPVARRLRANGAELVGEVAQYDDNYRLCYMRGPAGIIVALAENSSETFTAFGETDGVPSLISLGQIL
jgi:hypothetical protein